MANQITDNRTSVAVAQTSAPASETWEASGGGGSIVEDTDIFIEGTTSVAEQISSSRRVMLYDNGSDMDLSSAHLYIWVNCGIVGILDLKANGGLTVRFTGATSTDFFEYYVGGSDSWPTSIQGGWTMFVVDTQATASNTGGTPPAASAVRKVGISAITDGTMTKAADNTWVDAIWSLADGTPGIIVEGRSGGTTPWTFADIVTQVGESAGIFINGPGGSFVCNTPIQFGADDTVTHEFADTNALVLWDNQEWVAIDLYELTTVGNSGGTTNVTFGIKSGTGNDAIGAQGVTIQAAATGSRWDVTFNDADQDSIGLYGCTFIHSGVQLINDPAVDLASCTFIDCGTIRVDNANIVRASIVDANRGDNEGAIQTDDISDIVNSTFAFSNGHGIQIANSTGPTVQSSVGNVFTGAYLGTPGSNLVANSGSPDAMIANIRGASEEMTINVTGGGTTPSIRNGPNETTEVNNNIEVTLTGMKDNTEVRVCSLAGAELAGIENATDGTTDNRSFAFSLAAATVVDIVIFNVGWILPPNNRIESFTIPASDASIPISQVFDRNFENP